MQIRSCPTPPQRRQVCATCGEGFISQRRGHHVMTQSGRDLGPICNTCLHAKPEHLRQRIRRQAYLLRLQPQQIAWVWDGEQQPLQRQDYARLLDALAKERSIRYPLLARIRRLFQ